MLTREEINYLQIIPDPCDCCGEMVCHSIAKYKKAWFNKYLGTDERRFCYNCIKDRDGFAEEFLKIHKMPMGEYLL